MCKESEQKWYRVREKTKHKNIRENLEKQVNGFEMHHNMVHIFKQCPSQGEV